MKSKTYTQLLNNIADELKKEVEAVLNGLSAEKLAELPEVTGPVYSPANGDNCDLLSIEKVDGLWYVEVSPFSEEYTINDFGVISLLTILEGCEDVNN